jgi:hypothetical protein
VPEIVIENVEDLYALYVFIFDIEPHDFWHLPLKSVQLIAENKSAIGAWQAAEEERQAKRNGR